MINTLRLVLSLLALLAACGPDSKIPDASCQTSQATAALCQEWGAAQGCKSSSYVSSPTGCKFADCDEPPNCTTSYASKDAGVKDAGLDPACKTSDPEGDGIFTGTPPCTTPHTLTINGVKRYTCPCSGGCPCGYQCGSIPLASGGVVSSVCAPAQ